MSQAVVAPTRGKAYKPGTAWAGWSVAAPAIALSAIGLLLAVSVLVGADAMWLVAMGERIVQEGAVPVGVPFATAESSGWPNVPVLGEIVFHAIYSVGVLALPFALILMDLAALAVLAVGAKDRGAAPVATSVALVIASLGMLPALGIVRSQFLSWVPFAVLLLLLRRQHERPDWHIWLVVPLLALWGNLHGGVLVGVVVTGAYLILSRLRNSPITAVGVGSACLAALFLTPAHIHSATYYFGVLTNTAAERREELWAPLNVSQPLDLLLALAGAALLLTVVARRLPLWEWVVLGGLLVGSVLAARHGPWLLMFLVAPAAASLSGRGRGRVGSNTWSGQNLPRRTVACLALLPLLATVPLAFRSETFTKDELLVASTLRLAEGRTVLAPEPLAEELAAAGGRVWLSNPIDAFSSYDQAAYLDAWKAGHSDSRALRSVDVVVAPASSPAEDRALKAGFAQRALIRGMVLLERLER